MSLRVALVVPTIAAALLSGCGSTHSGASKPISPMDPAGAVVTSVATHTAGSSLDLQRVVVRISSRTVTATFSSYRDLSLTKFRRPRCDAAGVTWPSRSITLAIPSYYQPNSGRRVASSQISVKQINSRTVQLAAPRAAFGQTLQTTDPWRAYAAGPNCPPMMVELEWVPGTGLVHPT